jgi:hypothetical protein
MAESYGGPDGDWKTNNCGCERTCQRRANRRQHYKKLQIQPWDYILANNIGYCEGSAIKYLSRWRDKGGIQDLYKAKHFIDKLIEHEEQRVPKP